ncbi:MAG: MFS transporter [Anaerolineae bacterium]
MASVGLPLHRQTDEATYRRRIRAWTLYDWANSAFATTILAAVLPVYFSQVAGASLPSEATATAYWTTNLSISLFITAILAPVLGTISDVTRGKKKFLAIFTAIGVIATGLLVLVGTGDWVLASILFIFGRVGFVAAYTFYDSLLPHIAKPEDQDSVSARGYAMGYLGGGLLLAINVGMIFLLPGTWGPRISFLSVAIWWAVFSIPIFRQVPEPAADSHHGSGESVLAISFKRLGGTLRDIRHYRDLFKYLVAYLIYNDAIGTIIGVAAIYGAELGFGSVELILALLLVQFVGIPFSLIFGRLPSQEETRRPLYLAFIVFNLIALPIAGIALRTALPIDISGDEPPPYETTLSSAGQGTYLVTEQFNATEGEESLVPLFLNGAWSQETVSASLIGGANDVVYASISEMSPEGSESQFMFTGKTVELTYALHPDGGILHLSLIPDPLYEFSTEVEPVELDLDTYGETIRYGETVEISGTEPGQYILNFRSTGEHSTESSGSVISIAQFRVLEPERENSLPIILGLLLGVQAIGVVFAFIAGKPLFTALANTLDTRRSIILSLIVYTVIAIWGYFVNSTVEFWFLAWMVAIVQGGSQALSRSLYASMSPAAKSGEFFGLYGIMERFSSIIGPLIFTFAVAAFGSSRPAIISLIVFFALGGYLLSRVNIREGQRIAREEDEALFKSGAVGS